MKVWFSRRIDSIWGPANISLEDLDWIIDEKGEPNVIPLAYYFDSASNKIYINTLKSTKKVNSLRKNNVIGYCIDDPKFPFKGVRGKGTVKIHEDVNHIST